MHSDGMDIDSVEHDHSSREELDSFNSASREFMEWLRARKGVYINPGITLADLRSQGAGRGVVSNTDLAPESELFTIPHTSILSTRSSSLTTTHMPEVMKELNETHPWPALVLALIFETRKESEWRPYIQILPREFNTLMFWDEKVELRELQGCEVVKKIGKEEADKGFREVLGPVVEKYANLFRGTDLEFDESGKVVDESLMKSAHRMASCIMSYSFDVEATPEDAAATIAARKARAAESGEANEEESDSDDEEELVYYKAMVPLADMLNADGEKNNARLFHHPTHLTMSLLPTTTTLPANTQLFNDYGPLPRSDLLRRYGYITTSYTPYDVLEVSCSLIVDTILTENAIHLTQSEKEARIEHLLEEGYIDDDAIELAATQEKAADAGGWWTESDEAVRTFQVLTAPSTSHSTDGAKPKRIPLSVTRSSQKYKSTFLAILKNRLQQYPTPDPTANVLTAKQESWLSETQRQRVEMAREVRKGEVEILRRVVAAVEAWAVQDPEAGVPAPKAATGKRSSRDGGEKSGNGNGKRVKA
ncbi:hypothetical protein DFH27DRAFT_549109 [Peziza echinospora]|nr:hypothetical protein DFH27DRAFT_549109 [Peziza echinospora]